MTKFNNKNYEKKKTQPVSKSSMIFIMKYNKKIKFLNVQFIQKKVNSSRVNFVPFFILT